MLCPWKPQWVRFFKDFGHIQRKQDSMKNKNMFRCWILKIEFACFFHFDCEFCITFDHIVHIQLVGENRWVTLGHKSECFSLNRLVQTWRFLVTSVRSHQGRTWHMHIQEVGSVYVPGSEYFKKWNFGSKLIKIMVMILLGIKHGPTYISHFCAILSSICVV